MLKGDIERHRLTHFPLGRSSSSNERSGRSSISSGINKSRPINSKHNVEENYSTGSMAATVAASTIAALANTLLKITTGSTSHYRVRSTHATLYSAPALLN